METRGNARRRFQSHVDTLLRNLDYVYEDGRKSALEVLEALVQKLPIEVR